MTEITPDYVLQKSDEIKASVKYLSATDKLDIEFKQGNPANGQTDGLYVCYVVTTQTIKGREFEIAEEMPILCDLVHLSSTHIAGVIDFRIIFTKNMLEEQERDDVVSS